MRGCISIRVPLCLLEHAYAFSSKHGAMRLRTAAKNGRSTGGMSSEDRTIEVERRCLVCDWAGTLQEPDDTPEIGPPCVNCHAPTERVAVRRSGVRPVNPHAA